MENYIPFIFSPLKVYNIANLYYLFVFPWAEGQ